MVNQKNKHYWAEFANTYDKLVGLEGDRNHKFVINPTIFDLLGDLAGKKVLDAGCGNGYLSQRLGEVAERVVGVDFTEDLIDIAKKRNNKKNIEYIVGDLEHLNFDDQLFDIVLCNLVLMDVENINKVMKELSRVLKIDGLMIISILHPCFENPPNTESLIDGKGEKKGRLIKKYFTTGLMIDKGNSYQHYHHTLTDYLNSFAEVNLFIEKIVEPNSALLLDNDLSDEWPYFMIIKLNRMR